MVFCNNAFRELKEDQKMGHNPYFNRWFSAIITNNRKLTAYQSHNPYFNRWFSAILVDDSIPGYSTRHNPYFNRWFSAMYVYMFHC